jgi:hypothetical protein
MVLLKHKAMKKLIITSILALLLAGVATVRAQSMPEEYLGLPGDNLNLYAVMDLFQKSETLEGFERSLNDENSRINNLDLNGDNLVDYITVSDYVDGDVHNIVLRVALNEKEYQDVAVFTVQKFADGSVQIQLIGDEALYGKNYIIEPNYAETPNPGYMGRSHSRADVTIVTTTYWDIATWPVIEFIYRPWYTPWHSAWYWGYWPAYWYSWSPYYWDYYYGYYYNWYPHYYAHYRHWDHYRCHCYNDYYYNRVRVYSPTVIININKGHYKSTYSRPEQRRDGEELYAREHKGQNNGTQTATNVRREDRRTINQSTGNQGRINTSSGTNERRTTGTVKNSSGTNGSAGRTTGTGSRSTTTVNKSTGNYSTGRNYNATRRSTSTGTYKSSNNSSTSRNAGSVNRSTTSGSNRSIGSSSSGRSSGSVHKSTTSGSNKSIGSSSTGRSSGSVHRSTTSGSNKSIGSSSGSRSSGSVHKSTSSGSGKGSTRTSGSGKSTSRNN